MTIVGFNFDRIEADKRGVVKGKINISNNVAIKNVQEHDLNLGKNKQGALQFRFEFTSTYEPKVGNIILNGNVIFMEDTKKVKEILAHWKKEKKVPQDVMTGIINSILSRCNIQALILSQEINLPPPIPLPRVNVTQEGEKKK